MKTAPFDLQKALAGHPLVTRDGKSACSLQVRHPVTTWGIWPYSALVEGNKRYYDAKGHSNSKETPSDLDLFLLIEDESKSPLASQVGSNHYATLSEVFAELDRATAKFPTWPTDPLHAFAVVGEEHGELQKEVLQLVYEPHKSTSESVRAEAVQLAAMSLRFLMSLDKYQYQPLPRHKQE